MPDDRSAAAVDLSRRRLLRAALVVPLAACSNVEPHVLHMQIAATGTDLEAAQVVALVYAQAADAEIDRLLYAGGDLTRAVKRVRDRHAQLRPWLERSVIGNTRSGFVMLRDSAYRAQLGALLLAENRDRAFLYKQVAVAVGHGGDHLEAWLPYASYAFGKEWLAQGAPGWWEMDEQRQWRPVEKVGAGGAAR